MENTLQIIKEQAEKLPVEVRSFLATSNWDETLGTIISKFDTPPNAGAIFRDEVLLILIGLVHPDAFRSMLAEQFGEYNQIVDTIASEIDEKIFAPVRPALIKFVEAEQASETEAEKATPSDTVIEVKTVSEPTLNEETKDTETPAPTKQKEEPERKMPFSQIIEPTKPSSVGIPENLPTEDTVESFLPKLIPKKPEPNAEVAPFEEKMKKGFTAGNAAPMPTIPEITPEPESSIAEKTSTLSIQTPPQASSLPRTVDPYREPIE